MNHVREYILRFCGARFFLPPPPPDASPFPLRDNKSWHMVHVACRGKLCRLPVSIIIHPPPTITTTIIYMCKELLCEKVQQFSLYICLPITSPYPILPCHSPLTWVVLPVLLIKMINITSDWNLKRKYCELHQLMLVCCCGGWAASKAVYVADLLPMRTISLYLKCNAMWWCSKLILMIII